MPLVVHFLNVGRGDCTIIEFPSGRVGMVDIDNLKTLDPDTQQELLAAYRESSDYVLAKSRYGESPTLRLFEEAFLRKATEQLTDPLAYYDARIGRNRDVFRFVATHPDMDHLSGLYRLHAQETSKSIINFWYASAHDFKADADWTGSGYDRRDWDTYLALTRSTADPKALQKDRGDPGDFWTEDGVELWAPTSDLIAQGVEQGEPNICSMVLKISYKGRSIVLGGDATAEETWPTISPTTDMQGISVLKASHHGRRSGFYAPAVKEMAPWLTITSVGEKAHDATESYRRYSTYTVSLRDAGDIRITVNDDGTWTYSPNVAQHWKPKREG